MITFCVFPFYSYLFTWEASSRLTQFFCINLMDCIDSKVPKLNLVMGMFDCEL